MSNRVYDTTYHGEQAVCLENDHYRAIVLPHIGANLISLHERQKGLSLLREPTSEEMTEFKKSPIQYGIPVLFPPNRFDKGTFSIGEKTYHFPVNEPARNNHLHGFLYNAKWAVIARGESEMDCFVQLSVHVNETHPIHEYFPHDFSVVLEYRISSDGLKQTATVKNNGTSPMPCMLGYHTAIQAPFCEGSSEEDYVFTATIGNRWQLDGRMLPTGNFQSLSEEEEAIKRTGANPFFEPMDNHYTASPQGGRNYATVTDTRRNIRLVYDVGLKYRHWMIWNNEAQGSFFCPEPQINMVNAPNVDLPSEETGLVMLQPGEEWVETSKMYVE